MVAITSPPAYLIVAAQPIHRASSHSHSRVFPPCAFLRHRRRVDRHNLRLAVGSGCVGPGADGPEIQGAAGLAPFVRAVGRTVAREDTAAVTPCSLNQPTARVRRPTVVAICSASSRNIKRHALARATDEPGCNNLIMNRTDTSAGVDQGKRAYRIDLASRGAGIRTTPTLHGSPYLMKAL